MRQAVVIVGSDLRQLTELGVAFRGQAFALTLAQAGDVVERAWASAAPDRALVICLGGREPAEDVRTLAATCAPAVFLVPERCRAGAEAIEAAGGVALSAGTDATLVVASLVARAKAVAIERDQEAAVRDAAPVQGDIKDGGPGR